MSEDNKINLNTGDEALIKAAKTGEGTVQLTPDLLKDIVDSLAARREEIARLYPKLVEECPYETRLAVTAWVFRHIVDHAKDGGTYRYLIYDRLGFGPDAYVPLYEAGGMTISNEFNLPSEVYDDNIPSEAMIEAGAKALYGDGWETKATTANKKFCRQKAKEIYLAMFYSPIKEKNDGKAEEQKPQDRPDEA